MIATLGSILLAICALPEAMRTFKTKRCGIGWGMLISWLLGEVLLSIFAIQTKQYVLLINYVANLTFLGIMLYFKKFSKIQSQD
jgi:uncharacterized protein with PQ loop repeat